MSFQAKLRLDEDYGKELVVLAADYEFSQPLDSQNLPNGKPNAGIVNVTIASGKDTKIIEWMVSPKMTKLVQIIFKGKDGSTIRLLELTNTYCVGYREIFDANDSNPMKIVLKLSAWDIRLNITYGKTNDWAQFASSRSAANKEDSSINLPGASNGTMDNGTAYQPYDTETPQPEVANMPATANVPTAPEMPAVPESPAMPDSPTVPNMPTTPDMPTIPDMPSAPNIPSVPDIPSVPNVPQMPETPSITPTPSFSEPTVPSFMP